jgi:hypothetical protein
MDYVIQPRDRALFKRCRRAWDFGARTRRNLEPARSPADRAVDRAVDKALHDALAVYYFPGMWDWQPGIVLPLVYQAFDRSVREQRAGSEPTTAEQESIRRGRLLLERYAVWAPSVDRFAPVRVDCDVDVQVPDPRFPGQAVTVGEAGSAGPEVGQAVGVPAVGGAVRYQDRVDLVVIDEHNTYWVVSHRVVRGGWPDTGQLLLDEQCVAWCWAWEMSYPGMRVAGTIYNELHIDALSAGPGPAGPGTTGQPSRDAAAGPRSAVTQHREAYAPPTPPRHPPPGTPRLSQQGVGAFRRTQIRRTGAEFAEFGSRLGLEALDMTDPRLPLYPNPSPVNCAACAYRTPCIAVNEGADAEAVLATSYRVRPPEPVQEGRLGGSSWSMGRGAAPPRFSRGGDSPEDEPGPPGS